MAEKRKYEEMSNEELLTIRKENIQVLKNLVKCEKFTNTSKERMAIMDAMSGYYAKVAAEQLGWLEKNSIAPSDPIYGKIVNQVKTLNECYVSVNDIRLKEKFGALDLFKGPTQIATAVAAEKTFNWANLGPARGFFRK